MDAVTYPTAEVQDFIEENLIPLRVNYDAAPHAADFNIKWTPTLITLDTDGSEHHRTLGFLSSGELVAALLLGLGKVKYDSDDFAPALEFFEKVLANHPKSSATPEALFLRGVTRYKNTQEASHLKEAFKELQKTYPTSDWTKRAEPYDLL